jgi:hypothetical protein
MMACGSNQRPWYSSRPEAAAVVAVLLDGVLVVDAGHQALVGDEQQRQAGRLVDAAALGLDDAVLDLVAHAQAVAAADAVGFQDQFDRVVEGLAVQGNGAGLPRSARALPRPSPRLRPSRRPRP